MKRILKLSTLAGAIVAAVVLTSVAPISRQTANAQIMYRAQTGTTTYYNGGYAPNYGGYSGYGYSPYGYGGYTYAAPRVYVTPYYRTRDYSPGIGTAGTYNGLVDHRYDGGLGFYRQPYGPVYNPYGYGGYGVYGF